MPFRLPPHLTFDPERGFRIYEGVVGADWTDRNGHMNVVYYRLAFDQATQHLLNSIGLWDNDNDSGSTFALEDHVTYQRELHPGRAFFVTYQLLDHSPKLIHAFLRLFAEPEIPGEAPVQAATFEHIGCYVDMRTRLSARMPAEYSALLDEIARRQADMPPPPEKGRVIGIRRRFRDDALPQRSSEPISNRMPKRIATPL